MAWGLQKPDAPRAAQGNQEAGSTKQAPTIGQVDDRLIRQQGKPGAGVGKAGSRPSAACGVTQDQVRVPEVDAACAGAEAAAMGTVQKRYWAAES